MESTNEPIGPVLVNSFGDRYLYQVNRNAFNMVGADSLYQSLFSKKLLKEYQLNIIIGTDSGLLPRYIAKQGVPAGARYIFVELPAVLEALRQEPVFDDLPPEIVVTTADDVMDQAEKFQLTDYVFLDAIPVHESMGAAEGHLPEYRELTYAVRRQIIPARERIVQSCYPAFFTLRQFENLTENRLSFYETLKDAFVGRTAIILAGGPSLRKALPWIKKNKERLVVIAVSRITRILQQEGVVPHLVVSVDAQQISFEVSREMLLYEDSQETPVFVHSNHASPLLVGQWPGRQLYYGAVLPWISTLNVDPLSYNGPTVSNVSVSLALHLGCTKIVLAGVDLCFGEGGQTHAAGSNEDTIPDLNQMTPQVETYGGRLADTNPGYSESLGMLGMQAQLAAECGCQLYNCSPDAAKVPLIDYLPLEELDLPDQQETATAIINLRVPESTSATRKAHYRRVKREIERALRKFQEVLNLSREALTCTDGLFGRNGMQRDFRHKIRMDKIERRLDGNSLEAFSILVKRFGLKKFLAILKAPKKGEEWTDEQIEGATREYYEAYVAGTEYLIELMTTTLKRIDARIEEEKAAPDFAMLLKQWQADGQLNRLRLWRQRGPKVAERMSTPEQRAAELLEAQFSRIMTQPRTSQIATLEKNRDLKHTRSKALVLFRRKAMPQLEDLAKGLSTHPDQEKAAPYLHFIGGLLAELKDQPEEAAACYEHLMTNPPHRLTEDALLQIVNLLIAANDANGTLLALECLSGISPIYLPMYGEVLKLVGRFEDAFNTYNRYLGMVPDDVAAMVRLGIFCREAKIYDGALELLRRALAKDPANGAALKLVDEITTEQAQLSA